MKTSNRRQDRIWFLETSNRTRLNAKEACSIESACRHNKNYIIHLLSTGNISTYECQYIRLLSKLPNFQHSGLNPSAELAETPLEPLYAEGGALHRSPYFVAHLSDFLRYVVLWSRGGVYLDTDVIVIRSLEGIKNSLFYQSRTPGESVANGILFFDKHHPVLRALISELLAVSAMLEMATSPKVTSSHRLCGLPPQFGPLVSTPRKLATPMTSPAV
nr:lactosylceramide 4-alpha-galactosyltransferase-like [Rhipicephalus microplus]